VFLIDPMLWNRSGERRRSYLAASLRSLDAGIKSLGGPGLLVLTGSPVAVLPEVARQHAATIFASADYGPYGSRRDREVAQECDLEFIGSPFLHPPGAVRKPDGSSYRVFTPFYRAWQALAVPPATPAPERWTRHGEAPARGAGWSLVDAAPDPPFPVGEEAAQDRWLDFAAGRLASYPAARDQPAGSGTSGLSAALKFGEVHPRSILADAGSREGSAAFIRQLCWRDFYGHLLAELPDSARLPYQPAFAGFPWRQGAQAQQDFQAWRAGLTGYPFVDAGMRQLAATGTMPNRLRMVVASFLVKDLHLDWRLGAAHFMQQLYDGDLANNQHGWQWTAGTGTDAAPYYRIFNPVTQGIRFDPQADYVRRWIPALADLPGAAAHTPWEQPRELWAGYPDRIVDHAAERSVAMANYEQVKQRRNPAD